jgi:hypothetical protein
VPTIAYLGVQNTPGSHQAAAYAPHLSQTGTQVTAKLSRNLTKLAYARTYSQRLCQRATRLVFLRLEGHTGMVKRTFGLHRRERIAHGSFAPQLCQGMKSELLFGRSLNQLRCWSDPSATCCRFQGTVVWVARGRLWCT